MELHDKPALKARLRRLSLYRPTPHPPTPNPEPEPNPAALTLTRPICAVSSQACRKCASEVASPRVRVSYPLPLLDLTPTLPLTLPLTLTLTLTLTPTLTPTLPLTLRTLTITLTLTRCAPKWYHCAV